VKTLREVWLSLVVISMYYKRSLLLPLFFDKKSLEDEEESLSNYPIAWIFGVESDNA